MTRSILVVIMLVMAGCAVTREQNINFAPNLTQESQQKIVSDTVKKLTELYLPAKNRLSVQGSKDTFGISLFQELRNQGYQIQEQTLNSPHDPSGLELRYILDQTGELYRLTIMIGTDSLSRPYTEENGGILPTGYWMYQGKSHE